MFNARRASISGCVAAVLAGGVLCRVEAQQPPAALSVPSVVNRYCVSCHNDRLKSGGLALATVGSHEVAQDICTASRVEGREEKCQRGRVPIVRSRLLTALRAAMLFSDVVQEADSRLPPSSQLFLQGHT